MATKIRQFARYLLWWLVGTCICASSVSAADMPSARISQIVDSGEDLVVFLHRGDEPRANGTTATAKEISAALGTLALPIKDVSAFGEKNVGLAVVLAIDVSASIPKAVFEQMQSAALEFVKTSPPQSQIAIVAIGTSIRVLADFTSDKAILSGTLQKMSATEQETALYEAIVRAQEIASRRDVKLPTRRAVVIVTDGLDDSRRGYSKDEVMTQIIGSSVPIYAVGLLMNQRSSSQLESLKVLAQMARASGGVYVQAATDKAATETLGIFAAVSNVDQIRLDCSKCVRDGTVRRLQVTINRADSVVSDSRDLRLLAALPVERDKSKILDKQDFAASDRWFDTQQRRVRRILESRPWLGWAILGAIVLGFSVLTWWWMVRRRNRIAALDGAARLHGWDSTLEIPGQLDTRAPDSVGTEYRDAATTVRYQQGGRKLTAAIAGVGKKDVWLGTPAIIGRGTGSDIAISSDSEASSRHAEISERQGVVVVRDLGSVNGTYLNGTKIRSPEPLADGDLLLVGRTEIRVYFS